ncbi:MAG: hypothetical protein KAR83_02450 [Thermodesulfovibrionales bacterium]|nr:hypothetical protein [Thermodesulfovibrionales bacterium]
MEIDWFEIAQTISIVTTLIFVFVSFKQNEKALKMSVTPRLSAYWDISVDDVVKKVTWRLNVKNYSDFPVYIRTFNFHLPKDDDFPKGGLKGGWHIPPGGVELIYVFQISTELWFTKDKKRKAKLTGWPVDVILETSIGDKWKARFKNIGPAELEFISIELK